MTGRIGTSAMKRSIRQILTVALLALYIAGSSNINFLHTVVHHDDVVVAHSPEQEKDPCHRGIYHNDSAHASEHDSHVSVSHKCKMCDIAYHGDQTIFSDIEFASQEFFNKHFVLRKISLDSHCDGLSSSRAPPFLI
jgi:hypothetical protein